MTGAPARIGGHIMIGAIFSIAVSRGEVVGNGEHGQKEGKTGSGLISGRA
jgi:hypothetical protein